MCVTAVIARDNANRPMRIIPVWMLYHLRKNPPRTRASASWCNGSCRPFEDMYPLTEAHCRTVVRNGRIERISRAPT